MPHAEQIFRAAVIVSRGDNEGIFSRDQVRVELGISREEWLSGYTAIFQGMRDDHPGGAPDPGLRFRNVFHRIEHGRYQLSESGIGLAEELGI